jgi:hypothetical protein
MDFNVSKFKTSMAFSFAFYTHSKIWFLLKLFEEDKELLNYFNFVVEGDEIR